MMSDLKVSDLKMSDLKPVECIVPYFEMPV